jgi:uncharacterized membrane protein YphA (DoxX/SURF4 family)
MNIIVLIIQVVLAIMFTMAGLMKSTQPKEKLVKVLPWINNYSLEKARFIGISELLGAIGILIPQLAGILPVLSPIAAIALAIVMVLAALHHLPKKEYKELMFNAVLFSLLVIVAAYRF